MLAVDTNILVYAHRKSLAHHKNARQWLAKLAEGTALWAFPVFSLAEFVRVVTHSRLFSPPSSLDEATSFLGNLLASPTLRILFPGPRFPTLFFDAVRVADARGNLVFDAQIAALCAEHGVDRLLTLDRDFARFPNLRVVSFDDEPNG